MMHKPIQIKKLSFSLKHKTCFDNFNAEIFHGSKIAIIGRNGSGKTTCLNILRGAIEPTGGKVIVPDDVSFGHVPQVIQDFDDLSGGQRFNKMLTQTLSQGPNVLLLDEPTNHLDRKNRKSLMRMLRFFDGTLIVVSHDVELLRTCIDTMWHIDNGKIHQLSGNYDDYMRERSIKRSLLEHELLQLGREKKSKHNDLMREQQRASKSKASGEKKKAQKAWLPGVAGAYKSKAEKSTGKRQTNVKNKKDQLAAQLSELNVPKTIIPTFSLASDDHGSKIIVSVRGGSVGYGDHPAFLCDINFSLLPGEKMALVGDNGSGKTTIVKALRGEKNVIKTGNWVMPKSEDIGYLDQHYNTIVSGKSVLETIQDIVPTWTHAQVRKHLNDFLFRKNEEVNASVKTLSGGEKARLSLAQIAAKTSKLLILDEVTNNVDMETRNHIVQVLKAYPGALIVISHDNDFLHEIGIDDEYTVTR